MLIHVQVVGSLQLLLEITQRDTGLFVSAIPWPASLSPVSGSQGHKADSSPAEESHYSHLH